MKSMNLKRFASTVMAAVLALALAVPAFATNSTNITGTYRAITLAVTVPTTGQAIINPYGLPYNIGDEVVKNQQITTGAPLLIANRSAVSLSVSASALGQEKGTFKFNAADPNASPAVTTKAGFVKMQMFAASGVTEANATDTDVLNQKFAALPADSDEPTKDLVVGTTASNMADIITLKKGTDNNGTTELADGGAAFFRLAGSVVKTPKTAAGADDPWTTTDGFAVKIAFTFEPVEDPAVDAGTIAADNSTTTLDSSFTTSETVTLTPDLPNGVTVATWVWTSSDDTKATVAVNNTDSTKATVTYAGSGAATITATGTGSDGETYVATIDFTCT